MVVEPVHYNTMLGLVNRYHYAKLMPAATRLCLGVMRGGEIVCASSWGWGTRPLHTIRKLFPSLGPQDYWELGKLCCRDEEPRNTESEFLARVADWIRKNRPEKKLLFTWADGMLGKPGYVYQAAGWLYGGFIWTETYFTPEGEKVHPRSWQAITQDGKKDGLVCGRRPRVEEVERLGWRHCHGKQFRYVKFLCSRKETRRLLRESTVEWSQRYPKHADLEWKEDLAGQGSRVSCEAPSFTGAVRFRSPAPLFGEARPETRCAEEGQRTVREKDKPISGRQWSDLLNAGLAAERSVEESSALILKRFGCKMRELPVPCFEEALAILRGEVQ